MSEGLVEMFKNANASVANWVRLTEPRKGTPVIDVQAEMGLEIAKTNMLLVLVLQQLESMAKNGES